MLLLLILGIRDIIISRLWMMMSRISISNIISESNNLLLIEMMLLIETRDIIIHQTSSKTSKIKQK